MKAQSYWIDGPWLGKLAIVPRPRGGDWLEDEVRCWQLEGVDVVVSLLTEEEIREFTLEKEADYCRESGIEFLTLPIPDLSVPRSLPSAIDLLRQLDERLEAKKTIAVHCRQGIGRSGLIASSLLVLQSVPPLAAMEQVSRARGIPVPETDAQRDWVANLSNHLVAAVR